MALSKVEKGVIITGVSVVALVIGLHQYFKQPKATININLKTGEGSATLGNKSLTFTKTMGVVIPSWNGYELSAGGSGNYQLTRNGKVVEKGLLTEYDGGSSYITVNHIS